MAFIKVGEHPYYYCVSTDVKTTSHIPAGAYCLETDTSIEYRFNGTAWQPQLGLAQSYALLNAAFRVDEFQTVSREDEQLKIGRSYIVGKIFSQVGDNAWAVLHIKTGANIWVGEFTVLSEGKAYFGAYVGPTFTLDGTELVVGLRNRVAVEAATTKVFHTPTYSALGTSYAERLIGAAGNPNSSSGGVGVAPVLVMPPNTSFFIAVQNKRGSAADVNIIAAWYELTQAL